MTSVSFKSDLVLNDLHSSSVFITISTKVWRSQYSCDQQGSSILFSICVFSLFHLILTFLFEFLGILTFQNILSVYLSSQSEI